MRKMTTLVSLLVGALLMGTSVQAMPTAPATGKSFSGASGTPINQTGRHITKMADAPAVTITVTPLLLPWITSAAWEASENRVTDYAREGRLSLFPITVNSPRDYTVCAGKMSWYNTVYSQEKPLWQDKLNPPVPFNFERGQVVWQLVDIRSVSGQDDISMDMLQMTSKSSDPDNVLGDTLGFVGTGYTRRAQLIKADGSVVMSGPASLKGARVIVFVSMKLFNVGDTQEGLDSVRNWIGAQERASGSFTVSYTAKVGSSESTAAVSTRPIVLPPFTVAITKLPGNTVSIRIVNAAEQRSYVIYSSDSATGPWQVAVTSAGEAITFPANKTMQFYRVFAQ